MLLKSEQFLARISDHKVSGLSAHDRHIELKGPNKGDPVVRFDISYDPDIKDGTIGFR